MADPVNPDSAAQTVAASALRAQQKRMRIIAENLANADSTAATAGGDPYRRQTAVFETKLMDGVKGVAITRIEQDQTPFRQEYQPGNPAADTKGYVKMPNIEPMVEALDMREAQRAYDANISVIETARSMDSRTLDLIKR